ncbi:hypothetical protein [Marinobacter shengliensis]|uniref:hypothetical protein n=1 Tax=Marinobacter shengliensis TaxID=1389223 RepID=UPI002573CD4D|nr:hypothetical protein [Marinobacter shengliensis]BEH13084.1 hypothetical protein MAALD49_04520 [Marinobacter shengliensis]
MQDQHEARREQVIERYLQASYGLWNALLTVNGLILAAATLVAADNLSKIKVFVVVLALLSIALLTFTNAKLCIRTPVNATPERLSTNLTY